MQLICKSGEVRHHYWRQEARQKEHQVRHQATERPQLEQDYMTRIECENGIQHPNDLQESDQRTLHPHALAAECVQNPPQFPRLIVDDVPQLQ